MKYKNVDPGIHHRATSPKESKGNRVTRSPTSTRHANSTPAPTVESRNCGMPFDAQGVEWFDNAHHPEPVEGLVETQAKRVETADGGQQRGEHAMPRA